MDGWIDVWMDGWMDGWMDEWMDGWMDACMHAWMDGCMHAFIILSSNKRSIQVKQIEGICRSFVDIF